MEEEAEKQAILEAIQSGQVWAIKGKIRTKPEYTTHYITLLTRRKDIGESIVRRYFPNGKIENGSLSRLEDSQLKILLRIAELSNDEQKRKNRKPDIPPEVKNAIINEQTLRNLRQTVLIAGQRIKSNTGNGQTTRDKKTSELEAEQGS